MRKRWLVVLILPMALSLASCLNTTVTSPPEDGEKKEKLPDTNSAIVSMQQDTLPIGN